MDTDQNSVIYELQVETPHLNATIGGELIDTYTFNGTQWVENADTSAIHTEWNIVGDWEYLETNNSFVYGCVMSIDSFDQNADFASGVFEFFYTELNPLNMQIEQYSNRRSLSDAQIVCSSDSIQIKWAVDSIQIDLDDASCEFYNGWGNRCSVSHFHRIGPDQFTPDESGSENISDVVIAAGSLSENLTWTLDSTGLLTISGRGPIGYYGSDYYDYSDYRNIITKIVIEDGITSIIGDVFESCENLTSVTIPDSVISIGDYAFYDCPSLTSVTIPNSVISIGTGAFGACSGLTSINVASGNSAYISVDGVLFNADQTLLHTYPAGKNNSSYNIPDSVTSIEDCAFSFCGSLRSVTIPNSVTSIGEDAFRDCYSLSSVAIPDNVTSIEYRAFSKCGSLTSITIPNNVISIGVCAFSFCGSLSSVTIPNSVTSIGDGTFEDCSSLAHVYYAGNEAQWNQITIGNYNDSLLNATIHYNS